MAVTAFWYGLAIRDQWGATAADRVDWVTDTIKCSLHTVTYAPNQDTDAYFTAATNELAATGNYVAGGNTLAGKTLTYDGPSNTMRLKANDVTFANLTSSAGIRYAVVRKDTGTGATSHLMGYVNMGADQSPAGVNFVIQWDATDGVLRGVVS